MPKVKGPLTLKSGASVPKVVLDAVSGKVKSKGLIFKNFKSKKKGVKLVSA